MLSDIPNQQEDILTDVVQELSVVKRKNLLPWWIKVFMWIFLVFGVFAPIGFVLGIMGYHYQLSLYGLDTSDPMSTTGICILLLFLLKGLTSYGLLREEDWAIKLGLLDAVIGSILCILIMIFPIYFSGPNAKTSFRLELVFLLIFLNKLLKIKYAWENYVQA